MKTKKLGMSPGKARNLLVNTLLFRFAQETEMDRCFRCEKPIVCVEDCSIDHIQNWLHSDNPVEVYFDLNNIAFSHRSCNYAASKKPSFLGKTTVKCTNCDLNIELYTREYNHKKSRGQKNFYCNRKCFVEHKNYFELSDNDVREIRRLAKNGESTRTLAKKFNKSHVSISHCINRATYKHVK